MDFAKWLEYIFPPSQDEVLVKRLNRNDFLSLCYTAKLNSNTQSLSFFSEPSVRASIHLAKFHHHTKAIDLLSILLKRHLDTLSSPHILIPVPLSNTRYRQRGYNQVTEIINHTLNQTDKHQLKDDILIRIKNTPPQTSLSRHARKSNLHNAFTVKNIKYAKKILKDKKVLVVDDVTTTGTTFKEIEKVLKKIPGSKLSFLSLAH